MLPTLPVQPFSFQVHSALLPNGLQPNVRFTVGPNRHFIHIQPNAPRDPLIPWYDALALPGMANVHSHAFQHAFAGLSEFSTAPRDSFWTWRSLMYDFVDRITPESMYTIAFRLYRQMLEAGYTWVGEFHYVHRDRHGAPYQDLATLSLPLIQAAQDAGVGLCMLPTLYQRGGFQSEPLAPGQDRFFLSEEEFLTLHSQLKLTLAQRPDTQLGFALHSLRAVDDATGLRVVQELQARSPHAPIHMHVAEQQKEVEQCLATHGSRPIAHALRTYPVDQRWCFIHATQNTPEELEALSRSQAIVGLCPTTEANLGDGIFRAREFAQLHGRMAIGTDSHCVIDPCEELRWLEQTQRLIHHERVVLGHDQPSVGCWLYQHAAESGGQALAVPTGKLEPNFLADTVLLDLADPRFVDLPLERVLDRYIMNRSPGPSPVTHVMVAGRWVWDRSHASTPLPSR